MTGIPVPVYRVIYTEGDTIIHDDRCSGALREMSAAIAYETVRTRGGLEGVAAVAWADQIAEDPHATAATAVDWSSVRPCAEHLAAGYEDRLMNDTAGMTAFEDAWDSTVVHVTCADLPHLRFKVGFLARSEKVVRFCVEPAPETPLDRCVLTEAAYDARHVVVAAAVGLRRSKLG